MAKTTTGLDENVGGLLCYLLFWLSGIVFILLEPVNKFVRFHAFQSVIVFGTLFIAIAVLSWIPLIGIFFALLISIFSFVLWIILMIKAYQGKKYKLPWAGNLAEKLAG